MNIPSYLNKIKPLRSGSPPELIEFNEKGEVVRHTIWDKIFLTLVILLVGALSFGLGKLSSTGERGGVTLEIDENLLQGQSATAVAGVSAPAGTNMNKDEVSASSRGTKYYFSHCRNTISEKNRVTFATPALAEAAGYTLAANCNAR